MDMARPKEFDLERALHRAISAFSQKGFAATSTDELMRAMEVGRQSMYDTFGDKRALFLKALEVYVSENVRAINVELQAPGSPLAAIRSALVHFSERKDLSSTDGCMGINAICEFGMRDEDVTRITRRAANAQRHTLMDTLRRAQMEGELDAQADIESLADFFESTLAGIRIAAKAGKARPALRRIAEVASGTFADVKQLKA
jgi:TetR/AcrR family transcriptional regulator, transcriptional repressor for nem operon